MEGYVKVQVNLTDDLANDSRGMLYTKVDTSRGELCNVALLHGKRTWYYIRTNVGFASNNCPFSGPQNLPADI